MPNFLDESFPRFAVVWKSHKWKIFLIVSNKLIDGRISSFIQLGRQYLLCNIEEAAPEVLDMPCFQLHLPLEIFHSRDMENQFHCHRLRNYFRVSFSQIVNPSITKQSVWLLVFLSAMINECQPMKERLSYKIISRSETACINCRSLHSPNWRSSSTKNCFSG